MSMIADFREFITKGNVIDLAVAVVIGVAFNAVITAFVSDLITPLIGVAGHYDFSALAVTINGSVFQIGLFINALISFIILAIVVFFVLVRPMARYKEAEEKKHPKPISTKTCPQCMSAIPLKAKRCMYCTSRV